MLNHIVYGFLCVCGCLFVSCAEILHPHEYAQECFEQGKALRQSGHQAAAMQSFIKAERYAQNDYMLKGRIYSNMANMCRQAERHELAYEIYSISSEQFALAKDTLALAYALNNMAWEQAVMGHKDSASILVDSALTVFPSEAVQAKVLESRAAACLYAGEYDSVLYYAPMIADSVYGAMLMAQAYALNEQCDQALLFAGKVAKYTMNPRFLDDVLYIQMHCDSSAARAEVVALSETRTDVQRELEQYKSEMAQAVLLLRQSRENNHTMLWLIVAATVCMAFFVSGLYLCPKRSKRRQIEQIASRLRQSKDPKQDIPWDIFDLPAKLRERGLTDREVRIATLVMLGFSYAEIADILNRAENGIGKDKYVIAKKLGVSVRDLKTALVHIVSAN